MKRRAIIITAGLVALALIAGPPPRTSVIDGDTFDLCRWRCERIRLANIDAPEISGARCLRERRLGLEAKAALESLAHARLEIARIGRDRYGRTLAHVRDQAGDIGERLIRDGHAVRYGLGRPDWCQRTRMPAGPPGPTAAIPDAAPAGVNLIQHDSTA